MPKKRSDLTNAEIKEILAKPFEIWPPCTCSYCEMRDFKRAPNPDQETAFTIPHSCWLDICLCYGGSRGSKSVVAIAKGIWYALNHPGCTLLIGAKTLDLLKRTALREWQKRFTIRQPWDHPMVERAPNDHNKALYLKNGSVVWFLYFDEFEILRGTGVSFVHIEEASLIEDENALEELVRRMSELLAAQNQIMLTTNPEEKKGWLYELFSLKQFQDDYKGEPMPIGRPCRCQFCNACDDLDGVEVEWVKGKDPKGRDALICPRCPSQKAIDGKSNRFTIKRGECPGNTEFMRVVFFDPARNPHLPPGYSQGNKSVTGEEKYNLYVKGKVMELRQGKAYDLYSELSNVLPEDISLDYDKEMVWSFDFNVPRQCSVICQERKTPTGTNVHVVDEIVIPNAGPEKIAKEYLFRYPTYDKDVIMHGDPAALNNKIRDNDESQFQIIANIIQNPDKNMDPEEYQEFLKLGGVPKKVKRIPYKVKGKTKIGVVLKVDSLNHKLRDPSGQIGIFINPSCKWLIKSLEDMRWAEKAGRPALDVACDKADAKNPDKRRVRLVSHITDALGYYIAKKWPVLRESSGVFVVIPGDSIIEVDEEGNTKVLRTEEAEKEHKEYQETLPLIERVQYEPNSLLDILNQNTADQSFFGYFG